MFKQYILFVTILFALLLGACAGKPDDPYAAFRGHSEHKLFQEAENALRKKHYREASERFQALDALYPFSRYAKTAHLHMIYTYYRDDNSSAALDMALRYERLYPKSKHMDYVHYLSGVTYYEEGRNWLSKYFELDSSQRDLKHFENAFYTFSRVVEQYPKSPYAPMSRQYMIYIRQLMARNHLDVARYYMSEKAYQASIERSLEIIKHYQGTPAVIPALKLLRQSASKLGKKTLVHDAEKLLKQHHVDYAPIRQ